MPSMQRLIGERIKKAREDRGWTQEELAGRLPFTQSLLSRYEAGKRHPDIDTLVLIGKVLGKPLAYFLEEGYVPPPIPQEAVERVKEELGAILDFWRIPILGRVPAGGPIAVEELAEGYVTITATGLRPEFGLRVEGNSMVGAGILDGDFILIHRDIVPEPGDKVVVRLNGDEVTVKRLDIDNEGRRWLRAQNPDYPDILVENECQLVGVVVGVYRVIHPAGWRPSRHT